MPGNTNLDFYPSAITRTRQTGVAFDTTAVELLDRRQAWANPGERIRLARLLKLRIHHPGKPHAPTQPQPQPQPQPSQLREWGFGTVAHPVRTNRSR
ncbi:hypothetical protein AB0B78_32590 [Streptomyces sp. NPDC040724]|uniref:hypothetical protein n=1 Tax=Streptomyces sp. NPDC040724 TaxID=3155612 RepID=UPI0033C33707